MLRKQDITAGRLLSRARIESGSNSILDSLEETVYSAVPYTNDFESEVMAHTCEVDSLHSQVVSETTDQLAEKIRKSMGFIKDHAIPFTKKVIEKVENRFKIDDIFATTVKGTNGLNLNCVDHPFLNSPLYPQRQKNTSVDFGVFNAEGLRNFNVEGVDEEHLGSLSKVNHPDLETFWLNEPEQVKELINEVFNINTYLDMGIAKSISGEVHIDFKVIKNFDLNRLFRMYLLLSKLRASDDVYGISGVTLDEYRNTVICLWEGFNNYLPMLKIMCENYRTLGLTLFSDVEQSKYIDKDTGFTLLAAKGTVLYSAAFARLCSEKRSNIHKVTLNYLIHVIDCGGVPKLTPSAFVENEATEDTYWGKGITDLVQANRQLLTSELASVIADTYNETLNEYFEEHDFDFDKRKEEGFYADKYSFTFEAYSITETDATIEKAIMAGSCGPRLLGSLNLSLAAEILSCTCNELETCSREEAVSIALTKVVTRLAVHGDE